MLLFILCWAIIILSTLFTFRDSLNYYFFQDDWFVLNWVQSENILSFFKFRQDIIYWRPLSMPLYFFLSYKAFGLNSSLYHLVTMIILITLLVVVYKLFKYLSLSTKSSLTMTFAYGIWPIHFISTGWLSTNSYLLISLFLSLTFIFFIKFTLNKKLQFYFISLILYAISLMIHEFSLVFAAIVLIWCIYSNKKVFIKYLVPFLLLTFVVIVLRLIIYPPFTTSEYEMSVGKKTINDIVWYFLWAFNMPERFKDLLFLNFPKNSIFTLVQFWKLSLSSLALIIFVSYLFVRKTSSVKKPVLFSLIWFTMGLLPVLFLKNHSYPNYLTFSGIGLLYMVGVVLDDKKLRYYLLFIAFFSISSSLTLSFTKLTHWVVNHQAISKAYIKHIKDNVKNVENDTLFIFKESNADFAKKNKFTIVDGENTLKTSLGDQQAVRVIFRNNTLLSRYKSTNKQIHEIHTSTIAIEP